MARPLLPADLWREIAPLLPTPQPRPKGGRRPIENRAALTGILFVPPSGLPWEMLPAEMGCGCGMSCWRRLRNWQAAGVWARLHQVLLKRTHAAGEIDWGRASRDSVSVPAKKGACHRPEPERGSVDQATDVDDEPVRAEARLIGLREAQRAGLRAGLRIREIGCPHPGPRRIHGACGRPGRDRTGTGSDAGEERGARAAGSAAAQRPHG